MLRFSTDGLPERERIPTWREVFGRQVFRVDIEAPADSQFIGDITVHRLPGLNILSGIVGPGVRTGRTRELIADGVNDLLCYSCLVFWNKFPAALMRKTKFGTAKNIS